MARQPGAAACEVESSQLVDVIAKPSRVDDVPSDFSRFSTGQKPVAVFLNDFFSGTVLANHERVAPARCTIGTFNRQLIGIDDLSPTPVSRWHTAVKKSSHATPFSIL